MNQDYTNPSYNRPLPTQVERNRPYTVMKYQENYIAATSKVIDFFSMNNIKKYIDFQSKAIFHKELMQQILKQLREYLRKKATREFENMISKEHEDGLKLEEKFEYFDEIYFKKIIMDEIENKSSEVSMSAFETLDAEDEVLNQLQSALIKIHSEL